MFEQKIGSTYLREWVKEGNKANLVIIHGVGEHSGRYTHVGEYFCDRGINVYTGDLVGHGMSEGTRVFVKAAEDYLKDINTFLERIDNDKPIFILGHSMGGFVVLHYGITESNPRVAGIIASSPYIKEKLEVPAWKLHVGRGLGKLLPKFEMQSGLDGSLVCRDPEICKHYNEDKLNHTGATAGWYVILEKARKQLVKNAYKFLYPCLILQAGSDVVVDPVGAKEFYESLKVKDKDFELYEGFYHEILNDPEKERPLQRIYDWIEDRL